MLDLRYKKWYSKYVATVHSLGNKGDIKQMIIKNGMVFGADAKFHAWDIAFENGVITAVGERGSVTGADAVDANGAYVLPGYVDVHMHGAAGADFCDGKTEDVQTIAEYEGKQGVTTFMGTTMAFSEDILTGIFNAARPLFHKAANGATLRGVNMEGPFFNKAKKGAQAEKYIVDPDIEMFKRLYAVSGENIRVIDVAPELPGSVDFVKEASQLCRVSIAHTCATYEDAMAAYAAGADHTTHLFNAMPAFTHRAPGVVGAAADAGAYVELICDGIHIHPSVIRAVFKLFGEDKVCMISDSMRAAGMPNGEYSLGGQKVYMTDGKATLEDGTIAGSATDLAECVRRAIGFGIPMETAFKCATLTPAKSLGIDNVVGSLEVGKSADVQVLDKDLKPVHVWAQGNKLV